MGGELILCRSCLEDAGLWFIHPFKSSGGVVNVMQIDRWMLGRKET